MHEFRYKGNNLYCENIRVDKIAKSVETPFYLYSYKTLIGHYQKLKNAFKEINPLICFSMKANSNLAVCRALVNEGAGLDIVSGGELYRAKKCGVNAKKIVYAGIGKNEEEIKAAIKEGILLFNAESIPEVMLIDKLAGKLKKKAAVSIRINPNINPKTHKYIKTAKTESKFGLDFLTSKALFLNRNDFSNLRIIGVHIHIGSQITEPRPFISAIKKAITFIEDLNKLNVEVEWFNIGGGLGIVYKQERPQTAKQFAKSILPMLKKTGLKIILEPGRFIAGNSGILVAKVVYVKDTRSKRFVIVDAGMNDLIRPSLYQGYHEILPVNKFKIKNSKIPLEIVKQFQGLGPENPKDFSGKRADVVGPICESGDFLAQDRCLPDFKGGELLAVMGAGAYGFTMSSNYNSRRKCAEVMVIKNKFYTVRKREEVSDLIKGEQIPDILK